MARKTLGIRKNYKEEQRRTAISEAAIKMFSEKGYVSTTMDDIVEEAGCSKSLIYWYWGSKSDLFADLVDSCMTMYVDLFEAVIESDSPYADRILEAIMGAARIYQENIKLNKLVHFGALQTSSKPNENFREKIGGYKNRIMGLIGRLLQEGVDEGLLRQDIDVDAMAMYYMSLVEGYIYLSILEERMPLERVFGVMQNYFIPNIIAPEIK